MIEGFALPTAKRLFCAFGLTLSKCKSNEERFEDQLNPIITEIVAVNHVSVEFFK